MSDMAIASARTNDAAMLGHPRHERIEKDFYETPAWITACLMRHVPLERVWEPAAGNGAISNILQERCEHRTDAVQRDMPLDHVCDFLECSSDWRGDIVTNPPYKLAEPFVRHALRLTETHKRKVAMVLRNEFDCAFTRCDLFKKPPFALKIVLTKRPMWIAGTTGSPRHNYALYVFDWLHKGPAELRYDR